MAQFKEELYRRVIYVSSDEITNEGYSIFENIRAKFDLYLDNATSLSDDEKMKYRADFLSGFATQCVNQILQNAAQIALEIDLKEAQARSEIAEAQTKEAMSPYQIEKIKAETEIAIIERDNKDAQLKEQIKNIASDTAKNAAQTHNLGIEGEILGIERDYKARMIEAELRYKQAQADLAAAELEIKKIELEIRKLELPIKQLELELKRVQMQIAQAELDIKKQELEISKNELELKKQELEIRRESLALDRKRYVLERDRTKAQVEQAGAQVQVLKEEAYLRNQQAGAVASSLATQVQIKKIEAQKDIDVTAMQVTGSIIR